MDELLSLAVRLATEAAPIALSRLGHARTAMKADDSVVTDADHAIQAFVLDAIARQYPDHAVCAEETLSPASCFPARMDARYCWVIDPLDGSRNYAAGLPCFSTSIAVLDRGRPVAGVVFEHNLRLLYVAGAGLGATRNGVPIRVQEVPADGDVLTGIPTGKDRLTVAVLGEWAATPAVVFRSFGSTALHLAYVANGAMAATFCKRAKIWDIAAGALLVTEAGGRMTDVYGADLAVFDLSADPEQDLPFLAAAPQTHERLLGSVRRHARGGGS